MDKNGVFAALLFVMCMLTYAAADIGKQYTTTVATVGTTTDDFAADHTSCAEKKCGPNSFCVGGPEIHCFQGDCPLEPICVPHNITCTEDEFLDTCMSTCEASCRQRLPSCILVCTPPRCRCKLDLLRDTRTNKCVKPDQCLQVLKPKHERHSTQCPRFEERKVSIGCDSCSDILSRNSSPPSVCAHAPYIKCACIDGFARHTNGTCIPKGDCTEQKPFKDGKGGE